jgi:hypothetical protein
MVVFTSDANVHLGLKGSSRDIILGACASDTVVLTNAVYCKCIGVDCHGPAAFVYTCAGSSAAFCTAAFALNCFIVK